MGNNGERKIKKKGNETSFFLPDSLLVDNKTNLDVKMSTTNVNKKRFFDTFLQNKTNMEGVIIIKILFLSALRNVKMSSTNVNKKRFFDTFLQNKTNMKV